MKTTDPAILKRFYTVLNRKDLTEEIYEALLDRWELSNIDLEEEQIKINQRSSKLSKSKRDAVPEFLILKRILDEKKLIQSQDININTSENNNVDMADDQIILA